MILSGSKVGIGTITPEFALDVNGDLFPGWPRDVGGEAIGSMVFSDLDGDGVDEIISSVNSKIMIFNLDGSDFIYNTILHELPLTSAPTVLDVNQDGTLEVLVGTGSNLSSIDFKFTSDGVSSWNMHRGNIYRNGFYVSLSNTQLGDINQDAILDILDIVMLVNFAIGVTEPTDSEFLLSDLNSDSIIDVLDIVILVNLILN